ncbi:glycoside hydrolase family 1 protein [Sphingomonas sp.]|uniref:glycoside hydrolase family 1 protein n=1 Tax=Sphingomonas sp. TaxID=28214 RepID=UPI002E2F213B|nr:family 1 glycosylhydrolase [Sphingomonas sp.]HEX4695742.1 family 1 glycosylhydrolase [Sphingomonas sp.]
MSKPPASAPNPSAALTRRTVVAGAALGAGYAATAAALPRIRSTRALPPGFLWGTAISAHQSEGNNTNSDAWLMENLKPTIFKERSGDACDSYHRYAEDIAIAAGLGFNCYRLGIEWARIEPNQGHFSNAELDHYARVLETCRTHGLKPIVTFNHFTTPLWFAMRGGFEVTDAPDLFARYCGTAAAHLGGLMHAATTFNEANIGLLVNVMPQLAAAMPIARASLAVASKATDSPKFSRLAYADPAIAQPILLEAHRGGYAAIKAARPSLPVGLTLTTQDIQSIGAPEFADTYRGRLYGGWTEVARSYADFVGVQTYTRILVGPNGAVAPPAGAELTKAGYEFYPQALANTIRWAHATIRKPIYVTENGIATDDDTRRIAYIDQALTGLRDCIDEGIAVHSYLYWSLLDNFEWGSGFGVHFGLAAVDRTTFRRTLKPSARHLGAIARANRI